MLVITLIVVNVPVYLLIGWLVFDTRRGFFDTIQSYFTGDPLKPLTGEDGESFFPALKLGAFVVACALIVYGEYHLIVKLFF